MNLTDYPWRISYSSNENNPIADFYIPALECAVKYDRKSGFFNSAILSKVARGLGAMLHNHGEMRLIMGCQFSPASYPTRLRPARCCYHPPRCRFAAAQNLRPTQAF